MNPIFIAGTIEVGIYFLALIPAAFLYHWMPIENSLLFTVLFLFLAYHLTGILLITLTGLAIRLMPKPRCGEIDVGEGMPSFSSDAGRFVALLSLSTIPYRTPGFYAVTLWPIPALFYYGLAGAKIAPTIAAPPHVVIYDPYLVEVGERTILGDGCKLSPHVVLSPGKLRIGPIRIGAHCVIGGNVIIGPDVTIGEGATIMTGAGLIPGTQVGPGEVWAGSPARRVKKKA